MKRRVVCAYFQADRSTEGQLMVNFCADPQPDLVAVYAAQGVQCHLSSVPYRWLHAANVRVARTMRGAARHIVRNRPDFNDALSAKSRQESVQCLRLQTRTADDQGVTDVYRLRLAKINK